MPIDAQTAQRVRAEAERRGMDPDAALAEAERVMGSTPPEKASKETAKPGDGAAPAGDEPIPLLIGHLSFVLVRELRQRLGMTEAFPDDELPCGVWQRKHETGGAAAAPATEAAP